MSTATPRYANDFQPGQVFDLGWKDVTEQEIVQFALQWDPHPFHIDAEAAARSMFGGLTASGWQTALWMMQLMHRGFITVETSLGSPGHDELRWLLPVRPGDRLYGRVEVESVRISRSRPELGFVGTCATLSNQHGALVYLLRSQAMFRTRAAAGPA